MNWKSFSAMLMRDIHVAARNILPLILMTMLQPLLYAFVFGTVMIRAGLLPASYKTSLLPGIMAITMLAVGIQAVGIPLVLEFNATGEIEDRLLAPIAIHWTALERVVFGAMLAMIGGLMVIPASWLLFGKDLGITFAQAGHFAGMLVLVAVLWSALGLVAGCTVGQLQIGIFFGLVITPMTILGCVFYPWWVLGKLPILQKLLLLNPLVYASEGLRATLVPQIPHLPVSLLAAALAVLDVTFTLWGLNRFQKRAIT